MTIPIIQKLGGRAVVYDLLKERGFPIKTPDAVRMWESRGNVSRNAVFHLSEIGKEQGIQFDPKDYTPTGHCNGQGGE